MELINAVWKRDKDKYDDYASVHLIKYVFIFQNSPGAKYQGIKFLILLKYLFSQIP